MVTWRGLVACKEVWWICRNHFVEYTIAPPHLLGKFLQALLMHRQWRTFTAAPAKAYRARLRPIVVWRTASSVSGNICRPASGRQKSLPGFPRRLFRIISLFLTLPSQPKAWYLIVPLLSNNGKRNDFINYMNNFLCVNNLPYFPCGSGKCPLQMLCCPLKFNYL